MTKISGINGGTPTTPALTDLAEREQADGTSAFGPLSAIQTLILAGNAGSATALATARTLAMSGDVTWSVSFNGSANVTAAGTLATVNSNVGSFGDATHIPNFTTNGKGLVTAAASVLFSDALTAAAAQIVSIANAFTSAAKTTNGDLTDTDADKLLLITGGTAYTVNAGLTAGKQLLAFNDSAVNVTIGSLVVAPGQFYYAFKPSSTLKEAVYGGTGFATAAEYRAGTAAKALNAANVWSAAGVVALTDAATIAVDMSAFLNASVTLGGNRTLGTPSNAKPGQSGFIQITQDGTGSRTLAYGSNWKYAGGIGTIPALSTAAGAVDVISYVVLTSTSILITGVQKAVA